VIHDESRLLVSDELNGIISDEPPMLPGVVIATLTYDVGTGKSFLVGVLRSVLFGDEHEIEVEVSLVDAMALVYDRGDIVFDSFELKAGTVTDVTQGKFQVSALRMSDINAAENTCVLGFLLKRPSSDLITG
jgi:hypothetical protein